MRLAGLALSLFAAALIAGPAPAALASYPGRAGQLTYQDSYSTWDPLNNGAQTDVDSLKSADPPSPGLSTMISCTGGDAGFVGGTQFCPESALAYSPDGQTLAFAGAEYSPAGTSMPDQSRCGSGAFCPQGIIVAGADGSSPQLLPILIADAEHPAFMPGGHTLVFDGRVGPGQPTNVYTAPLAGAPITPLTSAGGDDPAPCPNGTIVYVYRGDLYLRSRSSAVRRLTYRGGTLPDCSHDSRTIVFLRRGTLYTLNTTGRHLRRLSARGAVDGQPAFSPAGGEVAYTTTARCTSHCGGDYPQCTNLIYRLEVISLLGRLRNTYVIGRNYCSSDGDLGGDRVGDLAWRPLP